MKQLVEYELENGNPIIIEVDLPEAGIERAGRGDQIIKAKERFAEALEHIKPVAQTVHEKLSGITADETGIEFGVKLSAKAGVIIASVDSEANFIVRLTWKRATEQSTTPPFPIK